MADRAPRAYTRSMAADPDRRNDLSYSPVPRRPREKQSGSGVAGLAAVTLLALAAVYLQFPAREPVAAADPPPAVMEQLPPPEAAIAPAREATAAATPPAQAPAAQAPAAPATENLSEAVFTYYTTEPGSVSRGVVRIDGKVVSSRKLYRGKKSDGAPDFLAMPPTNCSKTFLMRAGNKPIFKDAVTAALPAARKYSMEVRWYDVDGEELSRDAFDIDGKKGIHRHTELRSLNVPAASHDKIPGVSIKSVESKDPNANSMAGDWNVVKRPSWQPELPQQDSFFAP